MLVVFSPTSPMHIMTFLRALPDAIYTKEFFLVCIVVFFISEAVFKLPLPRLSAWVKPIVVIIIGAVVGVLRWALAIDALILGALAGVLTTLTVSRLDHWFGTRAAASAKKK